ncbi:MAG: beta-glucuronidase [Solirubrobacteraceae bacterium]|nr:beta-glucuronidase [Solirubrobacteraceae bacterium]
MRRLRLLALPIAMLAVGAISAPSAAATAAAPSADGITRGTIYEDGPDNRYLLGGAWLFRLDSAGVGLNQRFQRQASTDGWAPTTVPNAWNVGDDSEASMLGTVAWYRKDFKLPDRRSRLDWLVRFESVNYRATIWLNGRPLGRNTGAFLPFELRIPRSALRRAGTNRLVIRVDNRRRPTDFPPSGEAPDGSPGGGWWNYGGLLREVYLQRVDEVDVTSVLVRPQIACRTCHATVDARVTVRNYSSRTLPVRVTGSFGARGLELGSKRVPARSFASFATRVRIAKPRLWSPASPSLYRVRLRVASRGRKLVAYKLMSGVRSIKVIGGRLSLNYEPMDFRGVGLHEDDPKLGFAIDSARRHQIIAQVKELGATVIRSHYPLHPEMFELADRVGVLVWSEIPVYGLKTQNFKKPEVRRLAARELEQNIVANGNHPSIMLWSLGNELSSRPGPTQADYIKRATSQAHALDPTRPVGIAVAGYPAAGCRPQYAPLDVVGVGEYFGWYPGPNGQLADREILPDFLDQLRTCYPAKGIVVDEFGAEANRSGPVEEKGTYEYQQDFVNYHLGVFATKPWLSGAIYWTIQEFRVRPNWDGGNPRPDPPIHEKGLLRFDGTKKPAWFDVQRLYAQTQQYGAR